MGSDPSLTQLRYQVKTSPKYELNVEGKDIPINKVAAIAAGLVYNDNITEFKLYCKYKYNI